MIRKILILAAVGLALTGVMSAQTVDEVVAKALEAQGGLAKLESIDTTRGTGKIILQGGALSGELRIFNMRPNMIRLEMDLMGSTMVQAYDGENGWQMVPASFGGTGSAQDMGEQEERDFKMGADIDGLLIDYKEKGHEIELVGTEDMEGTEVYHLKITHANGRVVDQYFDTETGLMLKSVSKQYNPQMGQDLEMHQYFSDYKEVDGILFPHAIETKVMGQTAVQIAFEEFVVNPELDAGMFAKPSDE
ncbi:MAG TPA: hypothetical protein VLV83_25880 [Acidobacteriota bacterium]|nr:hypothetical protein [Acidobacteriota bacterium]